eukprot:TRINITY_DN67794_c0_g1_i11.p1 TRINITY_DN67794_c0_g1~~TRINITY_DN67794_c0_g1_i11.p1  ORF type:complete len:120 (+),score=11.19 TRINITY_DN67794_c0_g1_i11:89-448(+)
MTSTKLLRRFGDDEIFKVLTNHVYLIQALDANRKHWEEPVVLCEVSDLITSDSSSRASTPASTSPVVIPRMESTASSNRASSPAGSYSHSKKHRSKKTFFTSTKDSIPIGEFNSCPIQL